MPPLLATPACGSGAASGIATARAELASATKLISLLKSMVGVLKLSDCVLDVVE